MHPMVQDALAYMNSQLELIEKSLALLSEEQIWSRPRTDLNSVGNVCLHLAGNEYQHFVTAVGGRPLIRERSEEFAATKGLSREELTGKLREVRRESEEALTNLTEADLAREVFVPYRPEDWRRMKQSDQTVAPSEARDVRTVRTLLIRVPAHYGYHTGQIVLLSKLLSGDSGHLSGQYH